MKTLWKREFVNGTIGFVYKTNIGWILELRMCDGETVLRKGRCIIFGHALDKCCSVANEYNSNIAKWGRINV